MRRKNAHERLAAALSHGEVPVLTVEAEASPPAREGLLAVTPTRVVYTSTSDSWAVDLHGVRSVLLEQEYSRGLIRIESAQTRFVAVAASEAQRVVAAIRAGRP
ncbi:hypothetical protein J2X55_000778 [Microbacterium sp. 1154]|uniref:hypothetical protein n=1 Tax=Microbacterium sp. 1154 TaxID=2817733 RepID=UPI002866BD9F|nr:hypothetical protein [Microbacterium sp. 1154]MDR6689879.1 hypothetical protein [Microbacterium sp. 1154]